MNILSRLRKDKEQADIALFKERMQDEAVRKVTPALIEEYEDYLLIDKEMFVTCVVVGIPTKHHNGFPRNLPPNFTSQVMAIENTDEFLIDISYQCTPISPSEAMTLLDKSMYVNRVSMAQVEKETQKETGVSIHSKRYDFQAQDFTYLFGEIYKNEQKLFDSQYIIVIRAKSRDGLRAGISSVFGVLESNVVNREIPYHRILDTFIAALPFPNVVDFAEMQQLSDSCGALLPLHDPLTQPAETGLIYGLRKADSTPYIIDWSTLAAAHHIVIGGTGSGKTVELMKLLMSGHDMLGHRFIYITPKPDSRTNFLSVANYYGDHAQVIQIGAAAGFQNINPLQVMVDSNQTLLNDSDYISLFNNHLELLTAFFSVMDTSMNMDDYIIQSLIELYRRYGIIRKDVDTWKNREGKEYPVLVDLRSIWKEDAEKKNPSAIAMLNRTSRLETSWEYINRPTDIKMDKDIIVMDLSGVPGSLQNAMNVFVTGLMSLRFNTDLTKKTCVIIDEGRVFLQNKPLTEFIMKTYTQGRSYDMSAIFTTQQASDINKDMQELFKNNSFVNIIMGNVQPNSYKGLEDFFSLNEDDMKSLKTCGVGEGLVQVRGKTTAVKFALTDLEKDVILGDWKTVKKTGLEFGFKLVDDRLKPLLSEDGIMSDWIEGDSKVLGIDHTPYYVQRAFGRGTTQIWIQPHKVQDGKIMQQSIDHYGTVLQIGAYLLQKGFKIDINHFDDADIVAELNEHTIAIEYERPGSHTKSELIDKKQRLQTTYGQVVFVVPNTYYSVVADQTCVGSENTVARGTTLEEYMAQIWQEFKP
ncbi:MAG: ATP-binding protein [Methanosarcinaceae archaeon]|nr:ATP-binding protein [Methanosarcinaceae archaeon]